MAATQLSRLRWHAARAVRSLGPAGVLGAALIAAAALVALALRPMQAEAARLQAKADAAASATLRRPMQAPPVSPAEQLAAFESGFVGDREIPSALARLLDIARRQRLRIEQADFKLVSEASQPLQRYTMDLPVRGEYRALRRFVGEALREQPGLAMEEMSLRRADPRAPALDAQIRFVLFVRKPAAGDAAPAVPAVLPVPAARSLRDRSLALR